MSAGIAYSQMIDPAKVLGFLSLNKNWDPSLMLVMAGALAVYSAGFWLFAGKGKPLLAEHFHLPTKRELDKPLVIGSLLFGALWQLSLNPQLVLPGVLSRYVWRMAPFAITVVVLMLMSTKWFRRRWGAAKPEALARPYAKE